MTTDRATPLWSYHANLVASNNAVMPDNAAAGSPANYLNGRLFDTSAWESWTLSGSVDQAPSSLHLDLAWTDGNVQTIVLPENAAQVGSFMVAGRCLGPTLVARLTAGATFIGTLNFRVHNRPRLYDAPYTPAPLGTILANIPQQSIANGADVFADLPYYLGPARLSLSSATDTSLIAARVVDDQATPERLATATGPYSPQVDLWVPNLVAPASKWRLAAHNGSGAAVTFGATLVAG